MLKQGINNIGKQIYDVSELVDIFEAQEGEIYHIIGKTGMGKTTEGTRRAIEYLKQGCVVYTTWHLNLPDFYDERDSFKMSFFNLIGFQKLFFKFNYKENWKYLDIDRPDLVEFLAGLTDCIVFLDEGQDIFNANERIKKQNRKVLTRTRHLHKILIIISQRAQAVDTNFRANVTFYYKCIRGRYLWWPFIYEHRIYRTEELDDNNLPIWEDRLTNFRAELWKTYIPTKELYNAFNSWYLRAGIPKSQEVKFEAFKTTFKERLFLTVKNFFKLFKKEKKEYKDTKTKLSEEIERKAIYMAQNKEISDNLEIKKGIRQVEKPIKLLVKEVV